MNQFSRPFNHAPSNGAAPGSSPTFTNLTITGTINNSSLSASQAVFTDGSKNLVSNAITGTGNVVMSSNATLVAPALGTPTNLVGTNITGTAAGLSIGGNAATATTAGTVTTGAQPAITSVGTLTTLVMSGTLSVGPSASATSPTAAEFSTSNASGTYIAVSNSGTRHSYLGAAFNATGLGSATDTAIRANANFYLTTNGTTQAIKVDTSQIVTMSAYGAGAATFSSAGVISSVSDERLKIKDGTIKDPIPMLMALAPGYYFGKPEANMGTDRQLGFFARNVRLAIGAEATPDPLDDRPWGYYDRSVLAVVVESLKVVFMRLSALDGQKVVVSTDEQARRDKDQAFIDGYEQSRAIVAARKAEVKTMLAQLFQ